MTPVSNSLLDLIRARDYDAVTTALQEPPALLEQPNEEGDYPLHIAAQEGDALMAALLLDHGASVNAEDKITRTPLFWAARTGNRALCELLISRGGTANLDARVGYGVEVDTPLCEALLAGDVERARLLLDLGASPDAAGGFGTPLRLMFAWVTDELDLSEEAHARLFDSGPEAREAYQARMRAVFRLLLERGADPKKEAALVPWSASKAEYLTGVDFTEEIGLLLDHGWGINATERDAFTVECRVLLETGEWLPDYSVSQATALHIATYRCNLPLTRFLLERGADPNARTDYAETPLHLVLFHPISALEATWRETQKIFEALIASGADINARDSIGRTPLHWVANAFLDDDSDGSARSEYAAFLTQVHVLFANHGADFEAKDNAGKTALDIVSLLPESKPRLTALWRGCSLRALGRTETADELAAIQAKIERLSATTVADGLTEAEVTWLIETVDTVAAPTLREAASKALIAIARHDCRLGTMELRITEGALRWIIDTVSQSDSDTRKIVASAFGGWKGDYLAGGATTAPLSQEVRLLHLSDDYTWMDGVVSALVAPHPKIAVCLIILFEVERGDFNDYEYDLLWEEERFTQLCRYLWTLDQNGIPLFLRLMEEVAESLPEEEGVDHDFVMWPRGQVLRLCADAWSEIDLERAVSLIQRLYNANLITDAVDNLLTVVRKRVGQNTLAPKAAAEQLHPLLSVCDTAVERSVESYAVERNWPNYWFNNTIYDVAENVPALWDLAAAIASLDPSNAARVWEESVRLLEPYIATPPHLCAYQIHALCEHWDTMVKATHPDPKILFPVIAEKVVLLEQERYEPLLPHVLASVLNQRRAKKLAQQIAAHIDDEEQVNEAPEDEYVRLFFNLWARTDRDGLLDFTRNWLSKKQSGAVKTKV